MISMTMTERKKTMTNDTLFDPSKQDWTLADSKHPLRWLMDDHENPQVIALRVNTPGHRFKSTKKVESLYFSNDTDHEYLYVFRLLSDQYSDIFGNLCKFLIENTRFIREEESPSFVEMLYEKWKRFSEKKQKLSDKTIQGLIGEMLVLQKYLIPKYGEAKAIFSWTIEDYGKRDFLIDDTWCEAKSRLLGSNEIRISSLEQLDREDDGHLIVVKLDHSTQSSAVKISLNSLYRQMVESFKDKNAALQFIEMMGHTGYITEPEYDDPVYEYVGIDFYLVNEEFPRLRKKDLPSDNITKAEYSLSLVGLDGFKVYPDCD